MAPTTRSAASDYVSSFALELLDELRIRLAESRLVLQALIGEAELNFDELEDEVRAVQEATREAFEAASLMHQGAPLDAPWGQGPSRPRAIFARHAAAVRQGAHRVDPLITMAGYLERFLWQLRLDAGIEETVERPTCSSRVRTTGAKCESAAVRIGDGVFGAQCYAHATSVERQQYKVHHEALNARHSKVQATLQDRRRDAGVTVVEQWLQYREVRRQRMDSGDLPL